MEERILEILKEGEKSSSEITSLLSRGYYDVLKILKKLELENKIIKIEMGKYTFWRLKNAN